MKSRYTHRFTRTVAVIGVLSTTLAFLPTAADAVTPHSRTGGAAATNISKTLVSSIPKPCAPYAQAGVVCASKSAQKVWWIKNGKVQMTLSARFGTPKYPTRNGTFRVYWKAKTYTSKTYGAPMPFSLFYDGGRAVHFSYAFAGGDNGGSHGCIRLRSWSGASALFKAVPTGARVVVY